MCKEKTGQGRACTKCMCRFYNGTKSSFRSVSRKNKKICICCIESSNRFEHQLASFLICSAFCIWIHSINWPFYDRSYKILNKMYLNSERDLFLVHIFFVVLYFVCFASDKISTRFMPCDELNLIKFIQRDWMNKRSHSENMRILYTCVRMWNTIVIMTVLYREIFLAMLK